VVGGKLIRRVKDYYTKTEPKDAILMVCEDIAAALGEQDSSAGANGSA
jgi:hypothetical protein